MKQRDTIALIILVLLTCILAAAWDSTDPGKFKQSQSPSGYYQAYPLPSDEPTQDVKPYPDPEQTPLPIWPTVTPRGPLPTPHIDP